MKPWRAFALMAAVQFVSYANLTINYRAIAAGLVPAAMVTDALASAISFFIIRRVARDGDGHAALLGMMAGGSLAAWFGIWLTRAWS